MRYGRDFQKKIIELSKTHSIQSLSETYKVSEKLITKWIETSLSYEQLKYTVRQKFYNIFPVIEAKITSAYSDFMVCSITDEEWEDLSKLVSKELFELAYKVYKASLLDERCYQDTKKPVFKDEYKQLDLF